MKDAKGHGSNPRGAHAEGVDQIGKPEMVPIGSVRPDYDVLGPKPADSPPGIDPARRAVLYQKGLDLVNNIRAAIRRGEPVAPILIGPNGLVLDGHHRLLAYQAENVKTIPVERVR